MATEGLLGSSAPQGFELDRTVGLSPTARHASPAPKLAAKARSPHPTQSLVPCISLLLVPLPVPFAGGVWVLVGGAEGLVPLLAAQGRGKLHEAGPGPQQEAGRFLSDCPTGTEHWRAIEAKVGGHVWDPTRLLAAPILEVHCREAAGSRKRPGGCGDSLPSANLAGRATLVQSPDSL